MAPAKRREVLDENAASLRLAARPVNPHRAKALGGAYAAGERGALFQSRYAETRTM